MVLSDDTRWIVIGLNSAFISLLLTPLLCFQLYRFYKRRDEVFIAKRYPILVVISTILISVVIPINVTLQSITYLSPITETSNPLVFNICGRINVGFNNIKNVINGLLLCRFWLMFYDLNYSNSHINKKWKSYLDPSLVRKDFWLKYRTKLGSLRAALKMSCALIIFMSVPSIIYGQIYFPSAAGQKMFNYFITPIHILIMCAFLILAIKAPRIFDLFHLRFELKALVAILTLGLAMTYLLIHLRKPSNETLTMIVDVIIIDIGRIAYCLMGLVSTWFILSKLDSKFNKRYSKQVQKQNSLQLQRVLLDQENFELFAHHLAREFSIETLLAFIEMVQFKHVMDTKFNLKALDGRTMSRCSWIEEEKEYETEIYFDYIACDITKNAAIPKSVIVYKPDYDENEANDLVPFLKIAYVLYHKYIKSGVELEINISAQSRDTYINEMECSLQTFIDKQLKCDTAIEAMDLFEYFDCIIEEMYCLLTATCDRFLETDKKVNIARIHLTQYDTERIENTLHGTK